MAKVIKDVENAFSLLLSAFSDEEGEFRKRITGELKEGRCGICKEEMLAPSDEIHPTYGICKHPCDECKAKQKTANKPKWEDPPDEGIAGWPTPRANRFNCQTCGDEGEVGRPGNRIDCPSCRAVEVEPVCKICGDLGRVGRPGFEIPCPACRKIAVRR